MNTNEQLRINKYLAQCGVGSRRAVEDYILKGRVTVNGEKEANLSRKIEDDDTVEVDGKLVEPSNKKVYIALYKPRGVVTTCNDQFGRKSVLDLVQGVTERIYPIGRLDYDTEGLLLLTNDGDFALRLTHPSSQVEKTYEAILDKNITQKELEHICGGVTIDGVKTSPAKARFLNTNRKTVELIIHEGRNRQVRKMFESIGATVIKLKRTAIGSWHLGNMRPGEWKFIKVALKK